MDENRLICRVESEAKGCQVLVWIAGGIADELELVALDAEGLGGELLATVARVAVGGNAKINDRFKAGRADKLFHRPGRKLGAAIDLTRDDFGEAFGPDVGFDRLGSEDRDADRQGPEETDAEEGAGGLEAAGRHGFDATP